MRRSLLTPSLYILWSICLYTGILLGQEVGQLVLVGKHGEAGGAIGRSEGKTQVKTKSGDSSFDF